MEHKLGEIFEHDGVTLRVEKIQGRTCNGCFFSPKRACIAFSYSDLEACGRAWRKDGENVIFKLIKED